MSSPAAGRAGSRPPGSVVPLLTCLALALAACSSPEPEVPRVTQPTSSESPESPESPDPDGTSSPSGDPSSPTGSPTGSVPKVVGTVATGLEVPWGIDFLPDGTALVAERDSRRVLAIPPGGDVSTVGEVEVAAPEGEGGLLGLAVSPDFERDRTIYLYATTSSDNRVLRTTFSGGGLGPVEVVLDGIPKGFVHDGGRLEFGPDGHLYVSTGETGDPALAQDRDSLAGKILRITTDGDPAPGNPFPGSPVWSLGHRNVQGLAFDGRGRLWASEFGEQTFDELNLVRRGQNYGWPEVEGTGGEPQYVDPAATWSTDEASPSGLAWSGGRLWMAALRGGRLWRIDTDGGEATRTRAFLTGRFGRLRTVVESPEGTLWVATSNRDGRGEPSGQDDRIVEVRLR